MYEHLNAILLINWRKESSFESEYSSSSLPRMYRRKMMATIEEQHWGNLQRQETSQDLDTGPQCPNQGQKELHQQLDSDRSLCLWGY